MESTFWKFGLYPNNSLVTNEALVSWHVMPNTIDPHEKKDSPTNSLKNIQLLQLGITAASFTYKQPARKFIRINSFFYVCTLRINIRNFQ